jgi:IPT/TIG domain
MHDRNTGRTTRVSPDRADAPAASRDGRFVAFDRPLSAAPVSRRDVFVRDGTTGVTTRGSLGDYAMPNGSSDAAALSADARVLAYRSSATNLVDDDTNGVADVFVRVTTPVVRSVTPRGGPTAGGTTLTIDGEGFTASTTVSIGGVPAGPITFIDSTRLTVATPPHVAGLVDVVVTVPVFDAERLVWAFTYQ